MRCHLLLLRPCYGPTKQSKVQKLPLLGTTSFECFFPAHTKSIRWFSFKKTAYHRENNYVRFVGDNQATKRFTIPIPALESTRSLTPFSRAMDFLIQKERLAPYPI